jgi:hypothetical protein
MKIMENKMKNPKMIKALQLSIFIFSFSTVSALAQDRNQSWQFKGQNRASIAALIRDVERNGGNNGVAVSALPSGGYTNLVCGKDGQTSASANTTCIILNNSTGTVGVGQDANGNQTATTGTETEQSDADAVMDVLTSQN